MGTKKKKPVIRPAKFASKKAKRKKPSFQEQVLKALGRIESNRR